MGLYRDLWGTSRDLADVHFGVSCIFDEENARIHSEIEVFFNNLTHVVTLMTTFSSLLLKQTFRQVNMYDGFFSATNPSAGTESL